VSPDHSKAPTVVPPRATTPSQAPGCPAFSSRSHHHVDSWRFIGGPPGAIPDLAASDRARDIWRAISYSLVLCRLQGTSIPGQHDLTPGVVSSPSSDTWHETLPATEARRGIQRSQEPDKRSAEGSRPRQKPQSGPVRFDPCHGKS